MSRFERIVTFGSLLLFLLTLTFVAGYFHRDQRIWPANQVLEFRRELVQYRQFGVWGRPDEFVRGRVSADDPRVLLHRPEAMAPGFRAIMGHDGELGTFSVRLLDDTGDVVHVWPLRGDELAMPEADRNDPMPDGLHIFPDGSLVVNQDREAAALVRLDACGRRQWATEGLFHHSIEPDDDGLLWMWMSRDVPEPGAPPMNRVNSHLQSIVAVDPETGEVMREIRLEDIVAADRGNQLRLGLPDGFAFRRSGEHPWSIWADIFHPNDVEPLSAAMADAFEGFEAGDLLISMRQNNLLAVLDPDTLEIKWVRYGPWFHQHDPDFREDGTIEVFNNAAGRGASFLLRVDPATGEVFHSHPPEAPVLFSGMDGRHQLLPGGASLMTIAGDGRVVEISAEGELIFEYVNIVGDGLKGRVMNAQWLPPDHFDTVPSCAES